ncbi:MAG: DNRLRE domain-containing protein [Myxococcales bacterium]|nr:DNRLRE domain-containing protein [Myxococcales bacterium]
MLPSPILQIALLGVLAARAGTECLTVDEFNTFMETNTPSSTVTLTFDATGVNPNDWAGTKGALADLTDSTCAAGGGLALKVYGPDDPPNETHPSGTLKQEYGYNCGPMPDTETWADPNASEVVFTDGGERCDVTVWIDPSTFGYRLECDHGTWEGSGDNDPAMPVNYISLFSLVDGSTWRMSNATSTWNEVCFESEVPFDDEDTGGGVEETTESVQATQDVTVATDSASTVYADTTDLCVEANYSEVYLQFDLSSIPGTITSATLEMAAGADGSANGDGAEVYAAASAAWSENSLTWNSRPGRTGPVLDRAAPIEAGAQYMLDVSAAVSAPGVYAFALMPGASDSNGAHFVSKEGSVGGGPHLRVSWIADGSQDSGAGPEDSGDDAGSGDDGTGDGSGDGDSAAETGDGRDSQSAGCGCGTVGGPGRLAGLLPGLGLLVLARRGNPRGPKPGRGPGTGRRTG